MANENDLHINWENSGSWDEYEWESALKKGDEFAHSYFKLLERYADFPDHYHLIEHKLKDDFGDYEKFYDSDFIFPSELNGNGNFDEMSDEDLESEFDKIDNNPIYLNLKRTALGWCNIQSSLLAAQDKEIGLKILYYMGRSLATTVCTLNEDSPDAGNTAFLKRTLSYINVATGLLNQLRDSRPQIAIVLKEVVTQLSKIHDLTVDYLVDLRKHDKDDDPKNDDED